MAPRLTRSKVIRPGSRLYKPMAMNKNDAPQMTPMAEKMAQSELENAAVEVTTAGVGAGGAVVTPHL